MSKERLEEIRKLLVNLYNAVDVDEEMKHYIFNDLKIEWLIEQAERVQELEKQNKRYQKAIKESLKLMDEDGVGIRGFVYGKLKLIEALAGNGAESETGIQWNCEG